MTVPADRNESAQRQWEFWFKLNRCATDRDWEFFEKHLRENPDLSLAAHPLLSSAFQCAAVAGRADLMQEMKTRGFCFANKAQAVETLYNSLVKNNNMSVDAVRRLAAECPDEIPYLVQEIAPDSSLATLTTLHAAGIDVTAGGHVMKLALLWPDNAKAINWLYDHGADIYTPDTVAMLAGAAPLSRSGHYDVVAAHDAAAAAKVYKSLPSASLDDLRGPASFRGADMTGLHLAARSGCFADIAAAALRETKNPLTAEDLLRPASNGVCVLGIMAARRQLDEAFDARLWQSRPADAAALFDALKKMNAHHALDFSRVMADIHQRQLRGRSGPGLRLRR